MTTVGPNPPLSANPSFFTYTSMGNAPETGRSTPEPPPESAPARLNGPIYQVFLPAMMVEWSFAMLIWQSRQEAHSGVAFCRRIPTNFLPKVHLRVF